VTRKKKNATEETSQPSTSRNPEFSLKVTSPQSHKITQNEISELIKDLQLTNNTKEPFLQVYNSEIFWMTCESESISLTAKRFSAVLHNTR
jgi:hypothetical protein